MDLFRGLLKTAWSLVGLLLLSALAFSILAAQVGRQNGTEFFIGVGLLAFVIWQLVAGVRKLRRRREHRSPERPELPARARWVAPHASQRRRRW